MRVLLTIWVDAAWHPVVVFSSQVLAEHGYSVDILFRRANRDRVIPGTVDFGPGVVLHPIGSQHDGWRNQVDYIRFLLKAFALSRRLKPEVIIGYDMHGIVGAFCGRLATPRARLIYHNLDIATRERLRVYGKVIKMLEGAVARSADQTIFSASGRAAIFKKEARIEQEPIVVMNCQRIGHMENKTGELSRLLRERGLSFDKVIVRLGSLDPGHGVDATIRSVLEWKGRWGLVLAGVPNASYLGRLKCLIASLGLEQRVLILPSVSYSLWYDCLYSAALGIGLYEATNVNHLNMAGAGNKVNLYLKAGIPSICPNFPDFVAFMEKYTAIKVAETTDPHSIASAVNDALSDDEEYAALCRGARFAFETEYNFDKQFEPVLQECERSGR